MSCRGRYHRYFQLQPRDLRSVVHHYVTSRVRRCVAQALLNWHCGCCVLQLTVLQDTIPIRASSGAPAQMNTVGGG